MPGAGWNGAVRRSAVKVEPIVRNRGEAMLFLAPWFALVAVMVTALAVWFDRDLQTITPLVVAGVATLLTLVAERVLVVVLWDPRRDDCETWPQARARGSYEARFVLLHGRLPA